MCLILYSISYNYSINTIILLLCVASPIHIGACQIQYIMCAVKIDQSNENIIC